MCGATLASVAVQISTYLMSGSGERSAAGLAGIKNIPTQLENVLLSLVGSEPLDRAGPAIGALFALIAVGVAASMIWRASRIKGASEQTRRSSLFAVATVAIAVEAVSFETLSGGLSARYLVLPGFLLSAALVAAVSSSCPPADAQRSPTTRSRRVITAAVGLLLVTMAAGWIRGFGVSDYRKSGPAWSSAVSAAQARCDTQRDLERIKIPIAPQVAGEAWGTVSVPCDRLR